MWSLHAARQLIECLSGGTALLGETLGESPPPMKEWLIRLEGDHADLQDLPFLFTADDLTVTEEAGAFYLKALELNGIDNVAAVVARAKLLLQFISAAAAFHFNSFSTLDIGDLILVDENGVRRGHMYLAPATGLNEQFVGTTLDDGTFVPANRSRNVDYLVRLSMKFREVADSLQFFQEDSWVSLFKVYEIIRDDLGGDNKLFQTKWTTKAILSRFTHTAQSKLVLGAEARHARKKFGAPKVPMSKFEAHYFIRELLLTWMRTKSL